MIFFFFKWHVEYTPKVWPSYGVMTVHVHMYLCWSVLDVT